MEASNSPTKVVQLTKHNFKPLVLDGDTPVLIDFWAPWCGPCRAMKPVLEEAARQLDGQVLVAQVNVDEERELAAAFGIRSIPTCVLMSGDQNKDSLVGVVTASALVSRIRGKVKAA